jgi:hypothetical protein
MAAKRLDHWETRGKQAHVTRRVLNRSFDRLIVRVQMLPPFSRRLPAQVRLALQADLKEEEIDEVLVKLEKSRHRGSGGMADTADSKSADVHSS